MDLPSCRERTNTQRVKRQKKLRAEKDENLTELVGTWMGGMEFFF